ncbi:MAG: hypothetical protein FWF59_11345 [Turicibacter sp.]|nr:hypothetical protein [Turicibacter sp.]
MKVLKWIVLVVAALVFGPMLFRAVGLLFTLAIAVIAIAIVAAIGRGSRRDDDVSDRRSNHSLRTEFAEDEFNERELRNHRDGNFNDIDDHHHF